jgi:hypothetical protein
VFPCFPIRRTLVPGLRFFKCGEFDDHDPFHVRPFEDLVPAISGENLDRMPGHRDAGVAVPLVVTGFALPKLSR